MNHTILLLGRHMGLYLVFPSMIFHSFYSFSRDSDYRFLNAIFFPLYVVVVPFFQFLISLLTIIAKFAPIRNSY